MKRYVIAAVVLAVAAMLVSVAPRLDSEPPNVEVNGGVSPINGGETTDLLDSDVQLARSMINKNILVIEGEEIPVFWRERGRVMLPDPPFADHYDEWADRATEGDASMAFALSEMMTQCQQAFETEEELDSAVDHLWQTRTFKRPNRNQSVSLEDPEKIELVVDMMTQSFLYCRGLTTEQKSSSEEWLAVAARNGSAIAKLFQAGSSDDPSEAERLFREVWELGDIEGLFGLSHQLQLSYNSGAEPTNNIAAYAHLYLYTNLLELAFSDHGEIANRQAARVRATLETAKDSMHDYEIAEAIEMAKAIMRSNPKCCTAI